MLPGQPSNCAGWRLPDAITISKTPHFLFFFFSKGLTCIRIIFPMPCLPRCGILWVFFITYGCLGWVDKIRSSCGHDRRGLWPISFQPAAELRDQAKLGKLSYRELFLVGFFLLRTNIAEPCDRRLEVREIRGKDQVSRSRYFQGMRQHKGRRIQG